MDPHSSRATNNTNHGNEVLPHDTVHLIQGPRYQRGSPCKDPAGNRNTEDLLTIVKRRKLKWYGHVSHSPGLAKNRLARHSERGKKTRRTEEEVGRQHQGMDRHGVRLVPEGSREQGKMEENGCESHLWCTNDPLFLPRAFVCVHTRVCVMCMWFIFHWHNFLYMYVFTFFSLFFLCVYMN